MFKKFNYKNNLITYLETSFETLNIIKQECEYATTRQRIDILLNKRKQLKYFDQNWYLLFMLKIDKTNKFS